MHKTIGRRTLRSALVAVGIGAIALLPPASAQDTGAGTDDVVADDLVVEGSICASADGFCADGEDFDIGPGDRADLKLKDSSGAQISLDHTNDKNDWVIGTTNVFPARLYLADQTGNRVLQIEQSAAPGLLRLGANGVGINTPDPVHALEVRGDPRVGPETRAVATATNTSATDQLRTVFSIENFGPPSFTLIDGSPGGADWFFRSSQSGAFAISTNASSVVDMTLSPGGDLRIAGALTQASSTEVKHSIEPVDAEEVLDAVRTLDISTWSYDASPESRHMGPMSEDFHAAFGLGHDATGISVVDVDGVALASIQALAAGNAALEAQNATLRTHIVGLNERIAALEALVAGP